MSDHVWILPPTDGQPPVPILAAEPRPNGTPPRCRGCGVVVKHALTSNCKAIDPMCRGCASRDYAGIRPYRPSLLSWSDGVRRGRLLAEGEAACSD